MLNKIRKNIPKYFGRPRVDLIIRGLLVTDKAARKLSLNIVKVTKQVAKKAKKILKLSVKALHVYHKSIRRELAKYSKVLHHHAAKRPHGYMMKRGGLYAKWHGWNAHRHVHWAALGIYLVFIFSYVASVYRVTYALPDLTDTWDFSTPSDFALDGGLEVSGTSARLTAQNYTNDANTAALYHFDESSGTTVGDSSANNNDGTLYNGSFSSGNLNNAVTLDGSTSGITIPDSASVSLSQSNTIEAWTKFDSAFSAGSSERRNAIVDKGEYQLYYDNETGRLTYELADASANTWTQRGGNNLFGSWDTGGKRSVSSSVYVGGSLFVGLGNQIADAEVWQWNGATWTKIGGDGVNSSWADQTFEDVFSMTTDGANVYVGLGTTAGDAEVWRWSGSAWTKIGGDAINSSWQVNTFEYVASLNYFGGNLYAGLGASANDAEVWMWNGSTWSKIGGDSLNSGWTTNFELVASLANDGTNLYAGLGLSANDAEVWRWNGATWTQIGGDSLNSGWTTNIETVRSLNWDGTYLYAGTGDSAGDADVWRWNGSTWTQIGGDTLNSSWASTTYEGIYAFTSFGGNLYAGMGTGNGDGEVWVWDGAIWAKIGGDAVNSGWTTNEGDVVNTLVNDGTNLYAGTYDTAGGGYVHSYSGGTWTTFGGQYLNKSWGFYGQGSVEVMQVVGDYLYAGLGLTAGTAQVWRYDGSNWTLVGGQGVNSSWAANTYEYISSMSSHQGNLYIGLGSTANDAEVWMWNGATWTQIGGDSLNSGWTTNYEEVNSLASFNDRLYAGLGNSNNDAEVWEWDGAAWAKIADSSFNGAWPANYNRVSSMAVYAGLLHVGLGTGAGEAEVWRWNGGSSWTKLGGDDVNSSWDSTTYDQVESMMPYNNNLYVGLGNSTDDAEVWQWDGTTWTKIGGDDLNGSWTSGTYERVRTLAVYDGDLYAGLGTGTGDGEVWQYRGGTWSKVGGNSQNGSWANTMEEVESFSPYKGKLYAGTGNSANVDPTVWTIGNNGYLQSTTNSFDTNWHHVAATYDGTTMRIYIDGVQEATSVVTLTMPDTSHNLLIGDGYGGREYGKPLARFKGQIDELRISNIARSSFTTKPFPVTAQTATLNTPVRTSGVWHWDSVASSETTNGGTVNYRLSSDGGTTWQYWNGSSWVASGSLSQANSQAVLSANITTFPVTFNGIKWQAVLTGDGSQQVTLNSFQIDSTSDTTEPSATASSIQAYKANGGGALAQNDWTNGSSPYFTWTAGTDTESGILGYCLYLGTDNAADPVSTKGLLGTSPVATGGNCQFMVSSTALDTAVAGYMGSPLTTSNSPYYLTIKAIDYAGNVTSSTAQFYFRFDNTPPNNPGFITAPSGFVNTKAVSLTWPTVGGSAPSDPNSGLAGVQYRIGSTTWYGEGHTGTGDINDLLTNDGEYTTQDPPDFDNLAEGFNTVYFRTWDLAGNVTSTYTTAVLKINTSGSPSEPQNVTAVPPTNTTNAFAFDWDPPVTFVGDVNNITYCYTINTLPSPSTCAFTTAGVTSLGSGSYATQPGTNTFYVVARDESNNINYSSYTTVNFTANTTAPGFPTNIDIVDVSIKSTSNWRLAITWDAPVSAGSGVASYKIYRSLDNAVFSLVGSSSSTTYIDAGLSQVAYYYRVQACDSTNNCGADSSTVTMIPTGKFTEPANVVTDPFVSSVTTRRATIKWSTDRNSDSKVAIGTSSGSYSPSEVGNSDQVSSHQIDLDNLSAGTTYYFVAKWTDEDGNTGQSSEFSFTTAPAPTLKEIQILKANLSGALIQFSSKDATKVNILYGPSESFGGVKSINTATAESSYSFNLEGLADGTKYFFRLSAYDAEGSEYQGNIFSFSTPPRPKITNLRFQPIDGEPTSTQKVTWQTNVASSTSVTYGKIDTAGIDSLSTELVTEHEIIIRDLEDDSDYFLIAQSRDKDGNLAVSDRQEFRTALDTRPPKISEINIETSIRGTGAEARGQIIVSWRTDELASSQVEYAEGSSATSFNNKTAEDTELSLEHIVIVSDLPTSRVYSIRPVSRDRSTNTGEGEVQSAIVGRASDSVLTIILTTLKNVFGF